MARRDGLKNYKDLDLKDAKNDDRLTKVYKIGQINKIFIMNMFLVLFGSRKV